MRELFDLDRNLTDHKLGFVGSVRLPGSVVFVRVLIGFLLFALFATGCYLLLIGVLLQSYADASDPPSMLIGGFLWLTYLAMLNLVWGTSAAAMLWPGERSDRMRRLLRPNFTYDFRRINRNAD